MKKSAFLTIVFFYLTIPGYGQTDKEILNKTVVNLKSLTTISYTSNDLHKYEEIEDLNISECYFDFRSSDTILGAKYQFVNSLGEYVFDGKQTFYSRNDLKHVVYLKEPNKWSVITKQYSMYVLRKILPEIVNDTSIKISRLKDTVLNSIECFKFLISIPQRMIDSQTCKLEVQRDGLTFDYFLSISKKDHLPVQIMYMFQRDQGFSMVTFDHMNTYATKNDSIWSYDRFPKDYKRLSTCEYYQETQKPKKEISILNQNAPDWTLPSVGGDSVRFSQFKGKPVLLEFWFPYCYGCVETIPDINEIKLKYAQKGLIIYGIEFTRSNDNGLAKYMIKNKIEYPNLYMGFKTSKAYGIKAAPTFILIDKKGKVVFISEGLKKEELITAIDKLM